MGRNESLQIYRYDAEPTCTCTGKNLTRIQPGGTQYFDFVRRSKKPGAYLTLRYSAQHPLEITFVGKGVVEVLDNKLEGGELPHRTYFFPRKSTGKVMILKEKTAQHQRAAKWQEKHLAMSDNGKLFIAKKELV